MPTAALSQVKLGDRIAADVVTALGGTLFHRGRVVTPREYEILQAFLIRHVDIEPREGAEESSETIQQDIGPSALEIEYERLFALLKRIYTTNTSGIGLPILEIRTALERSEEHTSELQSRENLVCRLLLEKKKRKIHLNSH